ncbi:MAG: bifunctional ADP-dependent NAD(P)H-hydrate dehydratase/NAD(P)H-hydrate epimerase, partial [Clostridia bacterium]|nr:bifunctional ADP-dependent NAD(P)H-hydrate dehydratase/NAD(P)H-hydrate epimerase [Clostridia bacterium]
MYILTNKQMREADSYTIEMLGVPSLLLMERAGLALAEVTEEMLPEGKIVCLCGGGNNGGDGF